MNNIFLWMSICSMLLIIFIIIVKQSKNFTSKKNISSTYIPNELKLELKALISQGKKVKAIKKYRAFTNLSLKESEEYINQLCKEK